MAKKILIGVALFFVLFVIGFCLVVSLQPSTFSVERSATMPAPPAAVFDQINDLQAWDAWSPWRKLDPNPKTTMSNPSAGKGAKFTWDGNQEIGAGSLTVLDSQPDERVDVEQAFVRPFVGTARMTFTLGPAGNGTKVTWRMDGTNDFIGKAMCVFMNMDALLGKDFENGLASLKEAVEKKDAGS
ncbi:MAG TPA: SRPBCC family protein [Pirellulales bacterium]|jgi:hypothetical protein|nr:SRPBCC family protein [Pirellulales bacterium]